MNFYDLSVPLEDSPSEPLSVVIERQTHADSAPIMAEMLGASIADLPNDLGWANDKAIISSHNGTHVDAPWHYYPTCEGRRSRTIDEMPLEWFFSDGVVLDFSKLEKGSLISSTDLSQELSRIDYKLKPFDIVLIRTDADLHWGSREYFDAGVGMTAESTTWLIDNGIRVMGTDAWGWDQPFWAMQKRFQETQDPKVLWEAHRVGIEREYCHIEKLANLRNLPRPFGFKVACFPVKLRGGSAGWTRVVAMCD